MLSSILLLLFIGYPIVAMVFTTPLSDLLSSLRSPEVLRAIWLSVYTSGIASIIALVFGTPLSYILARKNFKGKGIVEGIVDLPIVIPHPVVGIAILAIFGRDLFPGSFLQRFGASILGTRWGIVTVLTFVGIPFYVDTVRDAISMIPERLEKVSRSLGASQSRAFFSVVLPLSKRSMLTGALMCMARAISEFGAVVVVSYHPMVASVLIFERFESYGLSSSKPVAVLLILLSLVLFVLIKGLAGGKRLGIPEA